MRVFIALGDVCPRGDAEPSRTRWKFLTGEGRLIEYARIALRR